MRKRRWIQHALCYHKRGALHRSLGIPAGDRISVDVLRRAATRPETFFSSPEAARRLGRRARLVLTLRKAGRTRKHRYAK